MQVIKFIPLFPLLGFLINGLGAKRLTPAISGIIASFTIASSFMLSLIAFVSLEQSSVKSFIVPVFNWISAGTVQVPLSFLYDPLTALMLLVITGIGLLIHIYSTSYMKGDEAFSRFFAYMNLFIFFMLILVMGSGYLTMFIGWEGVGLCSFLLIGFWFGKPEYNAAARKAFVMNRIGDLGFLLGIFLLFREYGSFEFQTIFSQLSTVHSHSVPVITWAALLLFIGAAGKSAQIPLYTWLPDAMAGPTPVSALIHAATMVTAGVYMVVRSNLLFVLAPDVLHAIAIIGLCTALLGATIAITQNDIKKILAYSTVSQLGYMFLGLGAGAFDASFFHVMTHAFFKALLFLGAGSVIHAMSGEQNIRKMGGLRKKLPITWICMLIGSLAIAGIPPFSGFFSKDEILANAFRLSPVLWAFGVVGSMLTAFYMFRMLFITFGSTFRGGEEAEHHLHESPIAITIPLSILAVLAAFGGFLNLPPALTHQTGWLENFLAPVLESSRSMAPALNEMSPGMEMVLMGISALAAIAAITFAWLRFGKGQVPVNDEQIENGQGFQALLTRLSYHKFYVDEFYEAVITKPLNMLSNLFYNFGEKLVIDQIVNYAGTASLSLSAGMKRVQNGKVRNYLILMVIGIILVFVWLIFNN